MHLSFKRISRIAKSVTIEISWLEGNGFEGTEECCWKASFAVHRRVYEMVTN